MVFNQTETSCPVCGAGRESAMPHSAGRDFEYHTTRIEHYFKKCMNCGVLYLDPVPAKDALPVIYPENYEPYRFDMLKGTFIGKARDFVQKSKARAIANECMAGGNILDIGCGSGALLMLMQRVYGNKYQYFANDINDRALENLERMGINPVKGDFALYSGAERYDVIIMNQVLEHLYSPVAVLEKAAEALRPGGMVFIETPNQGGADYLLFKNRYWGGYHFPRHFTIFDEKSLTNLLVRFGFEIVRVEYLASPSFWVQSIHHWILEMAPLDRLAGIFSYKNPALMVLFTLIDSLQGFAWQTSNIRIVARHG